MKLSPFKTVFLLSAAFLAGCQSDSKKPLPPQTEKTDTFESKTVVVLDRFYKTMDITNDGKPDIAHGLWVEANLEKGLQNLKIPDKVTRIDADPNQDGNIHGSEFLKAIQKLAAIVEEKKVSAVCITIGIEVPVTDLERAKIRDYPSLQNNHNRAIVHHSKVPLNETPAEEQSRKATLTSYADFLKAFDLLAGIAKNTPVFTGASNNPESVSLLTLIPNVLSVGSPTGQQRFIDYRATKEQSKASIHVENGIAYFNDRKLTTLDGNEMRSYIFLSEGTSLGTPNITALSVAGKLPPPR